MQFSGFEIECDVNATHSYYDKYNEPCMCSECTHFRKYFSTAYPNVINLLSQFGINVMFPIEIMDLGFTTRESMREYWVYFSAKGQLPIDKIESKLGEVPIILRNWNIADEAYCNTAMEKPYFIIEVQNIRLKDVKGEFHEAVSCGREIEFSYRSKHYFESRKGDKTWYIYCEETRETQYFTSSDELLLEAILDGRNINEIWEDIVIDCIL